MPCYDPSSEPNRENCSKYIAKARPLFEELATARVLVRLLQGHNVSVPVPEKKVYLEGAYETDYVRALCFFYRSHVERPGLPVKKESLTFSSLHDAVWDTVVEWAEPHIAKENKAIYEKLDRCRNGEIGYDLDFDEMNALINTRSVMINGRKTLAEIISKLEERDDCYPILDSLKLALRNSND